MKKNLLIIALAAITFTSCKKDDNSDISFKKLPSKITQIQDGDSTNTSFTYDNNQRVTLIKESEGQEIKLSYSNNNLVKIEKKADATHRDVLDITYTSGKPASAVYTSYTNNAIEDKFKITYTLTGNNVTEILFKDSTNTTQIAKNVISYTGSNPTKFETFEGNNSLSKFEITYGTKKGIFAHVNTGNFLVDFNLLEIWSKTEITKAKMTIGDDIIESTSTYTYNANSLPITAEISTKELPSGDLSTQKLKIEYK
jgi:hypothetical protein